MIQKWHSFLLMDSGQIKVNLLDRMKEPPQDKVDQVTVSWSSLFIRAAGQYKTVDCDGVCQPGTVTGTVGQRKCGKGAVLDAISGNTPPSMEVMFGSRVEFNGAEHQERSFVGYVRNTENFVSDLTVRDHIKFVYEMSDGFDRDIRGYYESVLVEAADKRISELTSSQKLVVKVAECEILRKRVVLVHLGGTDPVVVRETLRVLRRLCNEYGTTVVTAVDEASSKYLADFDRIILMSRGCTFYQGTYQNIKKYFAEKSILFSNEYGKPFKYNQAESTSAIVNEMVHVDRRNPARNAGLITFLADEYFKHKTGTELSPYLATGDDVMNRKRVAQRRMNPLKMLIFYVSYFAKKEFALRQAGFNIFLPEILFLLLVAWYRLGFKQLNLTEYFGSSATGNFGLLQAVWTETVTRLKQVRDSGLLPVEPIKNKDEVLYPLFVVMVYPILLLRVFVLTGFNINLSAVAAVLGRRELKQDFYKKHTFLVGYYLVRMGVTLIELVTNMVALGVLLNRIYPAYTLKLWAFCLLFRSFELFGLLLLYKFAIIFRKYKSITINLAVLIVKGFMVGALLAMLAANYKEVADYESRAFKGVILKYVLFSIFSSRILLYLLTMGGLVGLNAIGFLLLKYLN
ncbi:ABC family plasma membrane transporter [Enterospora canceri]|uniref:ABC family plasma membrane transporter n=1 Tax=Enterospora canceri TaxID=1081671 RepID=A0A1Y1S5I7_9MICR|nr:ABC family plasma membrane transporter [Enterospora canceri]